MKEKKNDDFNFQEIASILDDKIKKELLPAKNLPPDVLGLVGLNARPLFPNMVVPLLIERPEFIKAVFASKERNGFLAFSLMNKQAAEENDDNYEDEENDKNDKNKKELSLKDFSEYGVVGKVIKIYNQSEKNCQVLIDVQGRVKLLKAMQNKPFFVAQVKHVEEKRIKVDNEIRAFCREILSNMKELVQLSPLVKEELAHFVSQVNIEDPSRLADFAATLTSADKFELNEVLMIIDILPRLRKTLYLIKRELELCRLQAKISKQIEEKITKQQREFFLKEQLKEIQKELGISKDERSKELEKLLARAKKLNFSDDVQKVFDDELNTLSMLDTHSPEFNVIRNYLDWITSLPWGIYQKENKSLDRASSILEKDHYGLQDVKERILEFIATINVRGKSSGMILCLVGPPGVGKTSIGKSIARSLNRPFYRFSVGGMRDEAEIKGHRRTYIGAMPGKFIQAMKVLKKANPVIMLDEIDKIGNSFHGDPASALLEALDPEQNTAFLDHYLDVPFDLSKVLFIVTANQTDTIPAPLLDRMEQIRLPGYIAKEKLEIAKKYLIPKQRKEHGLNATQLSFSSEAIFKLIENYAREAGVRNLENLIKKICRKLVYKIERAEKNIDHKIGPKNIIDYLKKPIFTESELHDGKILGCVTGLAWTSMGGSILTIEAVPSKKKDGGYKQTGQLGKVMVESAEIAYSFVQSRMNEFKGNDQFFKENFIHLHVPEGATPKDGPSAGVTMATALVSLMIQKPVDPTIAMTGELTLTGKVLAIGGLKEKIIAARRAGIKQIFIPDANKNDYDDLEDFLKEGIKMHFVKNYESIFKAIFQK